MTEDNIAVRLMKLEEELDLLNQTVAGVYFWEQIRFNVYRHLTEATGTYGQAHTTRERSFSRFAKEAWLAARHCIGKNPFFVGKREFLFNGHPRRKLGDDGLWWDIYCDPITQELEGRYVHLEGMHHFDHAKPAKTRELRYLDALTCWAHVRRVLLSPFPVTTAMEREALDTIADELRKSFGVAVPIRDFVIRLLAARRAGLPLYRRLLRKVQPKLAVVVVSYGKHLFIEACQKEGIPVAELQHGTIYDHHLGYAFPGTKKRVFPDYLLTFGSFWNDAAAYPIPKERVLAVGYPYFTKIRNEHPKDRNPNYVLFLSQGTIGQILSKAAVELEAKRMPGVHVVYKLHPGEFGRWRAEYPWLLEAGVEVIEDEVPLYELFSKAYAQVGVNSTTLYEGLGYGLPTFLWSMPGVEAMDAIVRRGHASIVNGADELANRLRALGTSSELDIDAFLKSTEPGKIVGVLEQIVWTRRRGMLEESRA